MAADALAMDKARVSAAMLLTMQNKRVLAFS